MQNKSVRHSKLHLNNIVVSKNVYEIHLINLKLIRKQKLEKKVQLYCKIGSLHEILIKNLKEAGGKN